MPETVNKALDENQLADALIDLPGWEPKGKQIAKQYSFKTFKLAMEFVNSVAELAEKRDHHPDIHVNHTKVKILCWTHRFNGVTKADVALAGEIDKLFESS